MRMKYTFLICFLAFCATAVRAQDVQKIVAGRQTITPHRIEVSFNKTVHILFPAAVEYVDLGSTDLIAGKADGAQNVVRVKAAVRGFKGETNFSVISDDGVFYSFVATYADDPAQLSVVMHDWLHEDPYGDAADEQTYVRLAELGEETPLQVDRIMYTICKRDARPVKTIGSKRFGIQLLLKGIYVEGGLYYLHTSLRNRSAVAFDIDRVRFRIADRKVARRTAVQETFIEPVRMYSAVMAAGAGETVANVYVFRKFTIPDDKVFIMDVFERTEDGISPSRCGIPIWWMRCPSRNLKCGNDAAQDEDDSSVGRGRGAVRGRSPRTAGASRADRRRRKRRHDRRISDARPAGRLPLLVRGGRGALQPQPNLLEFRGRTVA